MPPPPSQSWVCMSDSRGGDEGPKVELWAGRWEPWGWGREALGLTGTRPGPFRDPELPGVEGPSQTWAGGSTLLTWPPSASGTRAPHQTSLQAAFTEGKGSPEDT